MSRANVGVLIFDSVPTILFFRRVLGHRVKRESSIQRWSEVLLCMALPPRLVICYGHPTTFQFLDNDRGTRRNRPAGRSIAPERGPSDH